METHRNSFVQAHPPVDSAIFVAPEGFVPLYYSRKPRARGFSFFLMNIMRAHLDLTDDEWERVGTLFVTLHQRKDPRGRTEYDTRDVLNGVLWVCLHVRLGTSCPQGIKITVPYL